MRHPRTVAALGVAALVVLLPATAASAHVRAIPESTAKEGFTKITFRVPNEQDDASTTELRITVPAATPLPYVSAQQLDGWTVKVQETTLPAPVQLEGTTITRAVSTITWTADADHAIPPGGFQEFAISGGPLPDTDRLAFAARQTYSDGGVVEWDQPTPPGGEEPEHPAPAFALTDAEAAQEGHGAVAAPAPEPAADHSDDADDADDTARLLAGAGLAVGAVALLVAVAALVSARRRPAAGGVDA
jgi:uncharacterized protein YcnI